jgi:hypothetical protein
MNWKKAISEEPEAVKQLVALLKSLKEAIRSNKSFVFQPLDKYPTSSPTPFDDPDVFGLHQEIHQPEHQQEVNLVQENPPKIEPAGHVVHQGLEHLDEAQNQMGVKEALRLNHQLPLTVL